MSKPFKPMLAAECETPAYPYLASPLLRGIRAYVKDGMLCSREVGTIPNRNMYKALSDHRLSGLDGVIVVGDPSKEQAMEDTVSAVTSWSNTDPFVFHVFDDFTDTTAPFDQRLSLAHDRVCRLPDALKKHVSYVRHRRVNDSKELDEYEWDTVAEGYSGVVLRNPKGTYVYGPTESQDNNFLILERFVDGEAYVVGFEEQLAKQKSGDTLLMPTGKLGALIVQDLNTGVRFKITKGMSDEERIVVWNYPGKYLMSLLDYRSLPVKETQTPIHPVFVGWKDSEPLWGAA